MTYTQYPHWRVLPNGYFLACYRTITGNGRLLYGNFWEPVGNWCYPSLPDAITAMNEWENPGMTKEQRPPEGWFREIHTGMRRKDGDPDKEYYAP